MIAMLELRDITLCRGGFRLQVDQLRLEAGRLYALQGENGAGKSSLLQLLALLQAPQRGEVHFAGQCVSWQPGSLKQLRQKITLLEQNPLMFSGTVEQNLAFGLKYRGIHGGVRRQRIEQALEATGLQGFNKRLARELSGGESRRVALARALALQPQVLLLDEPTANLDAGQVASLERFLVGLPQQGMTLVVATHDCHQPQRLGGDILRLNHGELWQEEERPAESVIYPKLQSVTRK